MWFNALRFWTLGSGRCLVHILAPNIVSPFGLIKCFDAPRHIYFVIDGPSNICLSLILDWYCVLIELVWVLLYTLHLSHSYLSVLNIQYTTINYGSIIVLQAFKIWHIAFYLPAAIFANSVCWRLLIRIHYLKIFFNIDSNY